MQAIRINKNGGPEVLHPETMPKPEPGPGEALVKIEAAGLNFIDTYHRNGLYPLSLPVTPGVEAAGVVEAVGDGVSEVKVGDRVAYTGQMGSYADYNAVPVEKLVPMPDGLDFGMAATAMIQGMTAHYLTRSTYPIQAGDTVLIHAAAGGTGQLLVQMAKQLGATVIGTTSTEEKAELARSLGADHVILYTESDFEEETKRLTDDAGVNVVYDGVGQATFDKGLNVLRKQGYMVLFGQSSGPVPPLDLQTLNAKGSLFVTRPSLFHYIASRDDLLWRAKDVFGMVADGALQFKIDRELPLAEAAEAHRLLESRQTAGKVLLIP